VRSRRYREQYPEPVARAAAVLAQTRRFLRQERGIDHQEGNPQ